MQLKKTWALVNKNTQFSNTRKPDMIEAFTLVKLLLKIRQFLCARKCEKRKWNRCCIGGAAVAEWLSSWLAEQEDRGSIPGLATWIFRDWLSPASKSRYGWKIAKSTLILKTINQPTKMLHRLPVSKILSTK